MNINILIRLAAAGVCAGALMAQNSPAAPAASSTAAKPAATPRENGLYASIVTTMGTITARLFEKESPITVKNFTDLAVGAKSWVNPATGLRSSKPLYSGVIFHRVIPGFMIQTGDPLGTGTGGTDPIPDEFNPSLSFDAPGKLGMANAGPQTGSCQFFITETAQTRLNGVHTIFGQVVEGQDIVHAIATVPVGANDRPNNPPKIVKITFQRVGPGPAAPTTGGVPAHKPAAVPTKKPSVTPRKKPTGAATPPK